MTTGDAERDGGRDENWLPARDSAGRSTAEWATSIVSLTLILGVVSLVIYLYLTGENRPPIIVVEPLIQESWRDGERYYVPIRITNRGEQTAADVRVKAELVGGGGTNETAELEIAFLAGGESVNGTVVFSADPLAGDLSFAVTSFRRL